MSRLRISIVGPFNPYRGGIATHTSRLASALSADAEVHSEAYRNPFPAWLYPGNHVGDLKGNQNCIAGVNYDLSYRWPGAWPAVTQRIINAKPDVAVMPWWTFFFSIHYRMLAKKLKQQQIPCVFLCHNFFDHEASFWKNKLSLNTLKIADGFVFHSEEEVELAKTYFPEIPRLIHPHPIYDHLPETEQTELPRDRLELLFFGLVRPYKGLEDLIDALMLLDPKKVRLTVAGEWWGKQNALLSRCHRLEESGQLRIMNRYISDEDTASLFAQCHAVILPYRKATNSGVLAHAIEARKPVIVTRVGALPSLVEDPATGKIVEPNCPDQLASAITELAQQVASGYDFEPSINRLRQQLDWQTFSKKLVDFLSGIASR